MKNQLFCALTMFLLASCANTDDLINKLPRSYSHGDSSFVEYKKYSRWSTYCQTVGGQLVGCGTFQGDLTVFITHEGRPWVIIGGNDYHTSGSQTCINIDGVESCLDNTDVQDLNNYPTSVRAFLMPRKGNWFLDKAFWDIEKAKTVSIRFMPSGEKLYRQQVINMDDYQLALAEIRKHLAD